MYSESPEVLLARMWYRTEVSVPRSTMQHEKGGDGLFASQNFRQKNVLASDYGSPAYADLGRGLQARKQFGAVYVEVAVESF